MCYQNRNETVIILSKIGQGAFKRLQNSKLNAQVRWGKTLFPSSPLRGRVCAVCCAKLVEDGILGGLRRIGEAV